MWSAFNADRFPIVISKGRFPISKADQWQVVLSPDDTGSRTYDKLEIYLVGSQESFWNSRISELAIEHSWNEVVLILTLCAGEHAKK